MKTNELKDLLQKIMKELVDYDRIEGHYEINDRNIAFKSLNTALDKLVTQSPDESLSPANVTDLIDVLKERNERWSLLELDYTAAPNNIANMTYLALAQVLEDVVGIGRYTLLMPKMTNTYCDVTLTKLNDKDVQLRHFVANEDGSTPIDLITCLEYATNDGVLKHTSAINGQFEVSLSKVEADRVINHSKYTAAYYAAIKDVVEIKKNGASFGSMLLSLIQGLRNGGLKEATLEADRQRMSAWKRNNNYYEIHKDNKNVNTEIINTALVDENARSDSQESFELFMEWFKKLHTQDKEKLLGSSNGTIKIENILINLMRLKSCSVSTADSAPARESLTTAYRHSLVRVQKKLYSVETKKDDYFVFIKELVPSQVFDKEAFVKLYHKTDYPLLIKVGDSIKLYGSNGRTWEWFNLSKLSFKYLDFSQHNDKLINKKILREAVYGQLVNTPHENKLDQKDFLKKAAQESNALVDSMYYKFSEYHNQIDIHEVILNDQGMKKFDNIVGKIGPERQLTLLQLMDIAPLCNETPFFDPEAPCVQSQAQLLESILTENTHLYSQYPQMTSVSVRIQNNFKVSRSHAASERLQSSYHFKNKVLTDLKDAFIKAIASSEYNVGLMKPDEKENAIFKRLVSRIKTVSMVNEFFEQFNYNSSVFILNETIKLFDPCLLAKADIDTIIKRAAQHRVAIKNGIIAHITNNIKTTEQFLWDITAHNDNYRNQINYLESKQSLLQSLCVDKAAIAGLFPQRKIDKYLMDVIVKYVSPMLLTSIKSMAEASEFLNKIPTHHQKTVLQILLAKMPGLIVDYDSFVLGLAMASLTGEQNALDKFFNEIPISIATLMNKTVFIEFLNKHEKAINERLLLKLGNDSISLLDDDFPMLYGIFASTSVKVHAYLINLLSKDILTKLVDNSPKYRLLLKCLSSEDQALFISHFKDKQLTLHTSIIDFADSIKVTASANHETLLLQVKELLLNKADNIDEFEALFLAFSTVQVMLYQLLKDKIVSKTQSGDSLVRMYKQIPKDHKIDYLTANKNKLPELISNGDELAELIKVKDVTELSLFDAINLQNIIKSPEQFIACAANEAFQPRLLRELGDKMNAFSEQRRQRIKLLSSLTPANRTALALQLIAANKLNLDISEPVHFFKLLQPMAMLDEFLTILNYFNGGPKAVKQYVDSFSRLIILLKMTPVIDYGAILRMVDLAELINTTNELHILQALLTTGGDINYLYTTIGPKMATIMEFNQNKTTLTLTDSESALLKSIENETADLLNAPDEASPSVNKEVKATVLIGEARDSLFSTGSLNKMAANTGTPGEIPLGARAFN